MDLLALQRALDEAGEPRYRAGQVWRWIAGGATSFDEMTDLSLGLRRRLASELPISSLSLLREARSADGTVKALFETADGRPLEAVLMSYRDGRRSVCVSSQSGCPLTCSFCATGRMSFGRNLSESEILDQVLHFRRRRTLNHAVFMGMGEPMMNLDAVLAACERLPETGICGAHTTVSTVGWVPGIERMASEGPPVRLALSLHAAEDALRSELMPVNERYPLAEVLEACRDWHQRRRRKVFIEYLMLAGVNDSPEQAAALAWVLSSGAGLQGQPDPLQPDRDRLRGLEPRGDRRLSRRARRGGSPRHRAPHPRPGHRRRLRPARAPPRVFTSLRSAEPSAGLERDHRDQPRRRRASRRR